jgi:hypothetical protein
MAMIENAGRITVFRDPPSSAAEDKGPLSADFCRDLERRERAAAKAASSLQARRVHQELAQTYAAALRSAYEDAE